MTSLWLALWIAAETNRVSARADQIEFEIKRNEDEVERFRQEEEKRKREIQMAVMSEQDAFELAAARRLIERKSLSWNRLISNIEAYVPNGTRITSIKVNGFIEGDAGVAASIEIKAIGRTPAEMTEMMTRMNDSKGMFTLGQSNQEQITDSNEVPFTINVTYRQ